MNLSFFQSINFDSLKEGDRVDDVQLRAPGLFRLFFKLKPLTKSDLTTNELPEIIKWDFIGDSWKPKNNPEEPILSHSEHTFYISHADAEGILLPKSERQFLFAKYFSLDQPIINFLSIVCGIPKEDIKFSDVQEQFTRNEKRYVVAIPQSVYKELAEEILKLMCVPYNAALLAGYDSDMDGYRNEIRTPNSILVNIVNNIIGVANIEMRTLERLKKEATRNENFEYANVIQNCIASRKGGIVG